METKMIDNIQAIHEKLYKQLLNFTLNYCGDSNVAKDAIGKAFLMLLENKVPPEESRSWLFANAKYEAFHDIHQVSKFAPIQDAVNKPDSLDFRPVEEDVIEREAREEQRLLKSQILSLVEKLTPRQRQVFNLRLIENQGVLEAGKNMGVVHSSVTVTLDRAIAKIRNDLGVNVQKETRRCDYGACKRERIHRSSFCENHKKILRAASQRRYHHRKAGWS